MPRPDTLDEVRFLWERVSAKTAANVIGSLVGIVALIELFVTVALMVAVEVRGVVPVVLLVHAPLMGLFALMVVVGGMRSQGWLYLPLMVMNAVYRLASLIVFSSLIGVSIIALFVDDAYLGNVIGYEHGGKEKYNGLRFLATTSLILLVCAGVALEGLFSYIHGVLAEAFKASRTVMKGRVGAMVERGSLTGFMCGGGGGSKGVKTPTAPVTTISHH